MGRAHGIAAGVTLGLWLAWLPQLASGQEGLPRIWSAPRGDLVPAPATALYTLKVRGEGAGRWHADHQSLGIVDPTLLGEDLSGICAQVDTRKDLEVSELHPQSFDSERRHVFLVRITRGKT